MTEGFATNNVYQDNTVFMLDEKSNEIPVLSSWNSCTPGQS